MLISAIFPSSCLYHIFHGALGVEHLLSCPLPLIILCIKYFVQQVTFSIAHSVGPSHHMCHPYMYINKQILWRESCICYLNVKYTKQCSWGCFREATNGKRGHYFILSINGETDLNEGTMLQDMKWQQGVQCNTSTQNTSPAWCLNNRGMHLPIHWIPICFVNSFR